MTDDEIQDMLELITVLPHETRCTIVYGPLCDCARGALISKLGEMENELYG